MPTVSVVMSVYNGEKFLQKAIDSILTQTYRDFEFIIIDDCSLDKSIEIINSYNDTRIRLIRNEQNMRLPASLNKGIRLATGKYIARMDADDISVSNRLAKQVEYMDSHPDVAVVGGSFQAIDEDGNDLYVHHAMMGEKLSKYCLMPSPLAHPTVMMRRDVIVDNNLFYDEQYSSAQDYDLWQRINKKFRMDNLRDILLMYRIQGNSISVAKRQQQQDNTYKIFSQYSPVKVSYDEVMAILHRSYVLKPWQQALIMYKVFHALDYTYWRNVVGYTVRYIMDKFNLNKSTAV